MYFTELAQRYLLLTVAITALCSLSLDAMPLSWSKTVKNRRSDSSETEIPTLPTDDAGTVHLHEFDAGQGGGMENKTFVHNCMKECYNISEDKIKALRKKVTTKSPHPSFFLSEMAESMHREEYCNSISKNDEEIICENENPQLSEKIQNETKTFFLNFLNPNTNTVSSQRYIIDYNSNNYPRYLIQVECTCSDFTKISVAKRMPYLRNTTNGWELWEHAEALVGCQCTSC